MLAEYLDDGSFDFGTGFFSEDGFFEAEGTATTPTSLDVFNPSTGVSVSLIGTNFPNTPDPSLEGIENATFMEIVFTSQGQDQMRVSGVSWNFLDFFIALFEIDFNSDFSTLVALFDQSDIITVDGTGEDFVLGSSDGEQVDLGDGDDVARTRGGNDLIEGGLGDDTIAGNGGADTAFGDNGDDTFFMGSQNDTVFGGAGEDVINGGFSADVLDGGADDDRVRGDASVDQINGGDGDDLLVGGTNADTFWFFDTDATGVDRIKDFEDGLDRVNLSDWGFASDADVFAIASAAGGADQHTRLDFTDGSGGETRALVIENLDISDFDASDFLLTGSDPFVF
ncbi:MAG: calcium-binding protein [Paracoccaceae bacterium]